MIKYNATYINLARRTDRNERLLNDWAGVVNLTRFPAVEAEKGGHGNYASHRMLIESMPADRLTIIMEDDIVPCEDFESRLDLFLGELPEDWDMFMLGFFANERSRFTQVTEHLHRVEDAICASHCYIVNPKSRDKILAEMARKENDKNIDVMLLSLQKHANVYIPIPCFCYQYQSYSDNGNDNYDIVHKGTIKYFKDKL